MHGARGGAPKGERNGNYHDGERSAGVIAKRQRISLLLKQFRAQAKLAK